MRYKIITGKDLSQDKYLKTWELDNRTFGDEDKLTKKQALAWFEFSGRSTIVLWDTEEDKLIGYITPFLLKHTFACDYIISSSAHYKKSITEECFVEPGEGVAADIYIFSTVVEEEYRDVCLQEDDKNSPFYKKTAFKVLNEAFIDWVCDIKEKGVSVNYVFAEMVSKDGEKYLKSLGMQKCSAIGNDYKYARLFSVDMFKKCSNINKLYDLYQKENVRKPFDNNLLANHEYLSIKENVLYYKDINLLDLIEKYKAPLEVAYTPIITEKIKYLKNLFAEKIKKYKYPSTYNYAYATKANYYSEVVLTALQDVDMLETSSAYDIEIIAKLAEDGILKNGYTIICNGFKNEKYVEVLKALLKKGINVIPIIENEKELELLSAIKEFEINVGLRYNSDFESKLIKNNFADLEEFDNRFGFNREQCIEMANKIKLTDNLVFKVLHFHFGGTITNIENYIKGFSNILELYCEIKKKHEMLEYFDFGGGLPVKYSLTYNFDYDLLVDKIIKTTIEVCKTNKTKCPKLIGEHGRFTVADHSFYIYKIDFTKENNNKNWYILNGSLMNMTPDIWGIQQDFTILPINLYENPCIPTCLGGETCDPDDRYFLKDNNVKLFLPEIKTGQTLYVAIFSVGAYQEIISGIGGLHHCLIPEGNELIIFEKEEGHCFLQAAKVTNKKKMLDILDYDNKKHIKNFIKKEK